LKQGDVVTAYPCDTIVLAVGTQANNPLEAELKGLCDVIVVGDAIEARKGCRDGGVAGSK
jgi:hypothetical protein